MALGLSLLAPTVGEFLLGNIPVSQYASVLVLAPLYGCGALLVRETARRCGGGWPSIVMFAAAYALIEEGPVDQMIYNPGYLGLGSFAGYGEIPLVGISGTLVMWSLALHTVWSIAAPIAVVESFDPEPTVPWLGRVGLLATVGVFLCACVVLGSAQIGEFDFMGTPAQFATTGVAIVALIVTGLLIGRRPVLPLQAPAPRAAWVGLAAFAVTSAYWLSSDIPLGDHGRVAAQVVSFVTAGVMAVVVVRHWSRCAGWDGRHRLALAAGALATYGLWFGPSQAHEARTSAQQTIVGAVVFGCGIFLVVLAAAIRQHRHGDSDGGSGSVHARWAARPHDPHGGTARGWPRFR